MNLISTPLMVQDDCLRYFFLLCKVELDMNSKIYIYPQKNLNNALYFCYYYISLSTNRLLSQLWLILEDFKLNGTSTNV